MKALWNQCQTVRQVSSSSTAAEAHVQTEMLQNATPSDCGADMTGVEAGRVMWHAYPFLYDIRETQ